MASIIHLLLFGVSLSVSAQEFTLSIYGQDSLPNRAYGLGYLLVQTNTSTAKQEYFIIRNWGIECRKPGTTAWINIKDDRADLSPGDESVRMPHQGTIIREVSFLPFFCSGKIDSLMDIYTDNTVELRVYYRQIIPSGEERKIYSNTIDYVIPRIDPEEKQALIFYLEKIYGKNYESKWLTTNYSLAGTNSILSEMEIFCSMYPNSALRPYILYQVLNTRRHLNPDGKLNASQKLVAQELYQYFSKYPTYMHSSNAATLQWMINE